MKSNNNRIIFLQLISGLVLVNIADKLNKLGSVDWSTFFISMVGFVLIFMAVIDYIKRKK